MSNHFCDLESSNCDVYKLKEFLKKIEFNLLSHRLKLSSIEENLNKLLMIIDNKNTDDFNDEKSKLLSFEEAFKYFEDGKGISRKGTSGIHYKKYYSESDPGKESFSLNDIRSKQWIIID